MDNGLIRQSPARANSSEQANTPDETGDPAGGIDTDEDIEPQTLRIHSTPSIRSPDSPVDPRSPALLPATPIETHNNEPEILLPPGETQDMFERPNYIDEHPAIRLTYLKAARLNLVHGLPVKATNWELRVSLESLWMTGFERPLDPTSATTLETVQRRLGLDTDSFLKRQPVCSECYQRFSLDEISSAQVNKCYRAGCKGSFWHIKNGERHPIKCIVYVRVTAAIRRLLIRPDFAEALTWGRQAHTEHTDGALHDICCGSAWLQNRVGLERVWRADGNVIDRTSDGRPIEEAPPVASLGYGLLVSVNIDWFGITENYSVGAVYLCFLNLHCSVRYRPENTILTCVIPGPGEPSLEELNQVLDPLVEELRFLYAGVAMKVYENNMPRVVQVHVSVHTLNSDSPARAKGTGRAGHAHHSKFCECECSHEDINTERGYDIDSHEFLDENHALRIARNSFQAPSDRERQRIASEHGMRWSSFNHLPQWKPFQSAPIDLMHNLYLGVVKTLWWLLINSFYFSAAQKREFDKFIDSIEWPSGIGRLPKKLATKGGLRKADEYRRLITVLPMALWSVWKQADDTIPDHAEPIPGDSKYIEDHVRSRSKLFKLSIILSAASRLLTSWSITLEDVQYGQRLLQRYCRGLLRQSIHLMPNHHFAMHYERYFRLYGPAYAWWLFAYERFNGILEKVQINRHPEDYETTLARFWIRMHRIYELVTSLPEDVGLSQICSRI